MRIATSPRPRSHAQAGRGRSEGRAHGGPEPREAALGIPVVGVVGHRGLGLARLHELLDAPREWSRPPIAPPEDRLERAGWADSIVSHTVTQRPSEHRATEAIDRIVLHPVAGALLFVAVMVAFFQLIFAWATPAMDWIDAAVNASLYKKVVTFLDTQFRMGI